MLGPRAALLLAVLLLTGGSARAQEPGNDQPGHALIVKLRGEGHNALEDCAERIFRDGRAFQPMTSDASPSLDEVARAAGVQEIRSLFRQPNATSFAAQRERLRARLSEKTRGAVHLPDLAHVYRVEISPEVSLSEALALFSQDPHVQYVQRDHTHELDGHLDGPLDAHRDPDLGTDLASSLEAHLETQPALPNDPFLHSSGSWGQAFEDLWGLHRIRAPEAWGIAQGTDVVVAVVDTGLDYEHEDIRDNVWVNPGEDLDGNGRVDPSDWNGLDDDENGFVDDLRGFDFANSFDVDENGRFDGPEDISDSDPFDDWGHGTHVAGTIAAVADNGIGIAGVAPRAQIMALKGFPASGLGLDSDLWRAVLYAAENGASVINTSWSCRPECPENPLAEEIVGIAHAMDVVIVTSAGNGLTDVVFNSPENMRETITVASSGQDDLPSESFTNYGWLVDVAAPGGGPSDDRGVRIARRNILSLRSSGDLAETTAYATVAPGYWRLSGTSMAAPHVAGVVALIRSAYPDLDYESVRRLLRQGAADTGPPGHDRVMGAGRVDAFGSITHPPLPDLHAAITSPRQGGVYEPRSGSLIEIHGTAAGGDLESYELRYGIGNVPDEWLPIEAASEGPVRNGLLATWSTEGLAQGTYVVRLEVRGGGRLYSEFLLVSLENSHGHRISSPGRPASRPAISDGLVAWQSRRDQEDANLVTEDYNLFASRFDGSEHMVVSAAAGDQEDVSVSGRVVSWLDSRAELGDSEVFACDLDLRAGSCADLSVSDGVTTRLGPVSAAGHVFWTDAASGELDIRACRLDAHAGSCVAVETGLEPEHRVFLGSDGASLGWSAAGSRIGACRVDPLTGRCPLVSPDRTFSSLSSPAVSGGLISWVEARLSRAGGAFRLVSQLKICEFDPETAACDSVDVMDGVDDQTPVLAGNRLVWDARVGDEEADVFFCEFDPVRARCPAQRITAQMARQDSAVVDGRLVAWEDDRNGGSEIRGIELPALLEIRDRRVVRGRLVVVRVRAADRERLALAAEVVGASLGEIRASFHDSGRGWGALFWRPGPEHVGVHAVTFSGETEAGLVTRRTIEIEVVEARRKWRRPKRSPRFR